LCYDVWAGDEQEQQKHDPREGRHDPVFRHRGAKITILWLQPGLRPPD
jgi:hypothetical protein